MTVATSITPPQAWAILSRHARDEIATLRLRELCRDDDRVAALVEVYSTSSNVWIADLSRQRMTDSTMNHLLCLATSMGLKDFIRQVSWGRNDPQKPVIRPSLSNSDASSRSPQQYDNVPLDETDHPHQQQMIPSMHMAIRVPKHPENGSHEEYAMLDGSTNVLPTVHSGWERVRSCSEAIRSGRHRGMTGSLLKDIVVVVMENNSIIHTVLEYMMTALQMDADAARSMVVTDNRPSLRLLGAAPVVRRTLQCVTSSDPQHLASVLESLDPASTLVVSVVVTGQEDSGRVTRTLKEWLIQGLTRSSRGPNNNNASPLDVSKHMLLVTGNERIARALSNDSADSVFLLPEFARSESLLSCSYATMLPLALVFGWEIVRQLLAGCHDMDKHFVETNPRHNIPVLLALTDIWNDLLGCPAHCITTGSAALKDYPSYVAAMEASLCGGPSRTRRAADHVVVVGDAVDHVDTASTSTATTTTSTMHSEMIMALDGQTDFVVTERLGSPDVQSSMHEAHDALVCNLLARADEMALSVSRPSVMLWLGKLHAFGCGQLLALTEHRALIKAHIWGVDPFYEPPRTRSVDYSDEFVRLLQDGDIDHGDDEHDRLTLATKTILTHYAGLVREQRNHQQEQEDEPS